MNKFSRRGKKILFGVLAMTMVAGMLTGCRSNNTTYSAETGASDAYYENSYKLDVSGVTGDYYDDYEDEMEFGSQRWLDSMIYPE